MSLSPDGARARLFYTMTYTNTETSSRELEASLRSATGFFRRELCDALSLRFIGESPFSHSALDIKTFAMCMLGSDYRESTKRNMPRTWFDDLPHTHVALDDALGQGALFCNMLREARGPR